MNERIRVREGVSGTIVVVGAWCPLCQQDAMPTARGECAFCGQRILDEDKLSSKELRATLHRQELGLADGVASGIKITLPEEPPEHSRRLLETLGAEYDVLEGEPAPGHLGLAREEEADELPANAPDAAPSSSASPKRRHGPAPRWTAEKAIAAVQAFAAEHGHPPGKRDAAGNPRLPSQCVAQNRFGSWADLIEQAGFPRPHRGVRYTKDSPRQAVSHPAVGYPGTRGDQEPDRVLPVPAPPAEVAQLEEHRPGPAGDVGSKPALRFALHGVLDSLRVLVDAVLPEAPE